MVLIIDNIHGKFVEKKTICKTVQHFLSTSIAKSDILQWEISP